MPLFPLVKMLGPSPLSALEAHMEKVDLCVQTLKPFIQAVVERNWQEAEKLHEQIVCYEHTADDIKHDLRLNMPRGLFLPVPRSDLLLMLSFQDAMANQAKDIAGLIYGRQMEFPPSMQENYIEFLNRSIDAVKQAHTAIHELEDLLEAGFRGNEAKVVEKMIVELDKIESDTDILQVKLRKELFNLEQTLPAVHVMFLYKIIEWTGGLADRAHTVGGQLLLLLAH